MNNIRGEKTRLYYSYSKTFWFLKNHIFIIREFTKSCGAMHIGHINKHKGHLIWCQLCRMSIYKKNIMSNLP